MNKYKLIIFDVDGTLINIKNSWQTLHEILGTWDKKETKELINLYEKGFITYKDFCEKEISLFCKSKLTEIEILSEIKKILLPHKNFDKMFFDLKNLGFFIASISSGLQFVSNLLNLKKYIDFVYCNKVEIKQNYLTNNFKLVVNDDKLNIFYDLLNFYNINKEDTIFVGDGKNDIPIAKLVGTFIAVNTEILELKNIAKFELSKAFETCEIDLSKITDFIKSII